MNAQLLIGLLFAIAPVMELRASIPILIEYAYSQGIAAQNLILLAIGLNILTILLIYLFLDTIHQQLLNIKKYRSLWERFVEKKLRKKIEKITYLEGIRKYFALFFFISLPLPGTGVWTSTTLAWILGLNRTKAFITIALGALVAGIIIFAATLGILGGLAII